MLDHSPIPTDEAITIAELTTNPYPIYKRLRTEAPVLKVASVGRVFLTKAEDTKFVKDNPQIFSSDDPNTPMKRAYHAHTLMRKDGTDHRRERMAMASAFSPRMITERWAPAYTAMTKEFLDRLPKDEVVDLFPMLAGPLAARILAACLGMPDASDEDMQYWSQVLIDGAGNFGWDPEPFRLVDEAHEAINTCILQNADRLRDAPDGSAISAMLTARDPIAWSQVEANIKIAIGGGINEPRDAALTAFYGLLTNPDQAAQLRESGDFMPAFEEAVRWCAPIQASSRLVVEDTMIRDVLVPKGEVVMTVQASANHDEDLFENPETFDINRPKAPHQAFGNGPHHCLGAHMARNTVGRILLPMFFERFPNARLANPEDVVWKGFGFRGPINMPVILN